MHKKNPAGRPPKNKKAQIWRYMDIVKFLSLLHTKKLYFPRADLLGDTYEGSRTKSAPQSDYQFWFRKGDKKQSITVSSQDFFQALRRATFINCWHMNQYESNAMWSTYVKGYGIAIQSTYARLLQVIDEQSEYDVHIGTVKYIDHEKESFPDDNNMLYQFVHKHKSYEYEKEIRAIIMINETIPKALMAPTSLLEGIYVNVNFETLIQSIILPPKIPPWVEAVITSILHVNPRYEQ